MPVSPAFRLRLTSALVTAVTASACGGSSSDDGAPGPLAPGSEAQREVVVPSSGRTRSYTLYVPNSANGDTRRPLVLLFHGGGPGSPQSILNSSGIRDTADAKGFLVAALRARGADELQSVWNAGYEGADRGGRDVAFADAVIAQLDDLGVVDLDRVYAAGFSLGGAMTYRLACQLSDRIAAVGVVSGFSSRRTQNNFLASYFCVPTHPMPIIHIHGLADTCVRYQGGAGTGLNSSTERTPIPETLSDWATRNGCEDTSPPATDRPATTTCTTRACDLGSEIRLCTLPGHGHVWPGPVAQSPYFLSDRCGGEQTSALDATARFWQFVSRYSLPALTR